MNEPPNVTSAPRSMGDKVLGIGFAVFGQLLVFAIIFPFVGIFVAVIGLLIAFAGIGLYAYGSKRPLGVSEHTQV
jgi:hypothetical protein